MPVNRWSVVGLYWCSGGGWRSRLGLALWVVLLLGRTALQVVFVIQVGEITSALAAQDTARFWQSVTFFLGVLVVGLPVAASSEYLQRRLALHWRVWLTHWFLERYLEHSVFYHLRLQGTLDNPDQRLEADLRTLTQDCLRFLGLGLEAGFQMLGFAGLLWAISKPLTGILVGYAGVGTAIALLGFGRPLVSLNANQLQREADFRYGLARLQDNAEAVALYQGDAQEQDQIWQRGLQALDNFNRLLRWQLGLNLFQTHYRYATFLLPGLILAPRLLSNDLEIGDVTQAGAAFNVILSALGLLVLQFQPLSSLVAALERLHQLRQAMTTVQPAMANSTQRITYRAGSVIALEHLTLLTPDGQQCLVQNLSVRIEPNCSLLITGASGIGKSSLLRAIAQLWQTGSGTITTPPISQIMTLPQKPYLMAGTLRQQLLYPKLGCTVSEEQLVQVIHHVNLASLLNQWGGLDSPQDWPRLLSPGEQQRLAFARLLLHQPPWALLDEATSALDAAHEAQLYSALQTTSTTYISVGHRPTLMIYHRQRLELTPALSWHLAPLLGPVSAVLPHQGLRQRQLCDLMGLDYPAVAQAAKQQGLSTHAYLQQLSGWRLYAERYYPPDSL